MSKEGDAVRRRRQCLRCDRRYTTYERIDEIPYKVIKKDGRSEPFDREKVMTGLLLACGKRPVSLQQIHVMVDAAEELVMASENRECTSASIGELLMNRLRQLDNVAYVRFASVYRDFRDEGEFIIEIRRLQRQQRR